MIRFFISHLFRLHEDTQESISIANAYIQWFEDNSNDKADLSLQVETAQVYGRHLL